MKSKPRKAAYNLFITLLFLTCCSMTREPVEIFPDDMCSFCKMAISQKQFAAEIITETDEVFKFDDIGCMLSFIKSRHIKSQAVTSYVMDFQKRNWIPTGEATFVEAREIETPMGGGVIAFQQSQTGQEFQGRLLTYPQLLAEKGHD